MNTRIRRLSLSAAILIVSVVTLLHGHAGYAVTSGEAPGDPAMSIIEVTDCQDWGCVELPPPHNGEICEDKEGWQNCGGSGGQCFDDDCNPPV